MSSLSTYLRNMRDIHATGAAVPETSYYGALESLINEVGKSLKPRVRCILHPGNRGAGLPDGGLFTADQFNRRESAEATRSKMLAGQLPERGAMEAKGADREVDTIATSQQVADYLSVYGQVLVTNFREFLLVAPDPITRLPVHRERYQLADSGAAFWTAAQKPEQVEEQHGESFTDFLRRVLLSGAELTSPKEVAWFLASYAREARRRIEKSDLPALTTIRTALEEALGISFQSERGDHFFRSSLIQTLFYGIFSAWVLWSRKHPPTDTAVRFDWRTAMWELRVPMIRAMFEQVALPSRLGPLNLIDLLERTTATLNRVNRAAFFEKFASEAAVQYFYEPFLEEFDQQLRKDLGVWYTPTEIVRYQVARVDMVLRSELGIPDGLADPRVYVLDPCCGTGAYLLEVIRKIHEIQQNKGSDALGASDLKQAALSRIFGFEILPAPFVVAHLQLGLLLSTLGAPLSEETAERVGVYLTNALTGWEPPTEPQKRLTFPELQAERDAAEQVKRQRPILVILGNPPYNAFSGVAPAEEAGLVEPYKEGLVSEWRIKKFNLDDLYVRFFRVAERRITGGQVPGVGVLCFISNFSYLGDPSFVVMRKRLLEGFDALWFDSLNGDSRETGKKTPDGLPDPSMFSTEYNREGIRVGTAIGLMVRKAKGNAAPTVRYREFWGTSKRADLQESLKAADFDGQYTTVSPAVSTRFSFRSSSVSADYMAWPRVDMLARMPPTLGILENRQEALVSIDRGELEERMCMYHDPSVSWEQLAALNTGLTRDFARFNAAATRSRFLANATFASHCVRRVLVRPMDIRWCFYSTLRPLWNEPRPAYADQCWEGNTAFVTRRLGVASPEGVPFNFASTIGLQHTLHTDAYYIPLRLRVNPVPNLQDGTGDLFASEDLETSEATVKANLSEAARAYLVALGIVNPDSDSETAGLIWHHALAIGCAKAYLSENHDGVRANWPRVPLPNTREALEQSAALGRRVAALLNTEESIPGVSTGDIAPEFAGIAVISRVGGGDLNPETGDLAVLAGWGVSTKTGVMPGKGRAPERSYSLEERTAVVGAWGEEALALLGEQARDVYLNEVAYWRNVPAAVWEYTIGGYQVIKKWLSYREKGVLGRDLTRAEVREVTAMARRIAALLLLTPELDANYLAVKANIYQWAAQEPCHDLRAG